MDTLTPIQRQVLLTAAVAQATGTSAGPHEVAEAIGVSHADVLRATADLIDAGLIQPTVIAEVPVDVDGDRLPMPRRAVLVALCGEAELDTAEIAERVGVGHEVIAAAVDELLAEGLLEAGLAPGTVSHGETGWAQTVTEIATGPAAGDPLSLRLVTEIWGLAYRRVGKKEDFTYFVADIIASEPQ